MSPVFGHHSCGMSDFSPKATRVDALIQQGALVGQDVNDGKEPFDIHGGLSV